MPIYEYYCDNCCHRFELKQKFNDEPVAICPHCRGKTRRVFWPAPIIFKGSGFYVTDVKQKAESYKKAEPDSSKEPAKGLNVQPN